jgi:hypothetical protein
MITKKKTVTVPAVICAVVFILILLSVSTIPTLAAGTKSLERYATWVVEETTRLSGLTIARGASIEAPGGHSVTMTVDGIGTAIAPGNYSGDIVLTVTQEIRSSGGNPANAEGAPSTGFMAGGGAAAGPPGDAPAGEGPPGGGGGMPGRGAIPFKTAVYVENNKYIPEKSVPAAVSSGEVTGSVAKNLKITSHEGFFSGIIVTGDEGSTYSIINPVIDITGNGGDDWTGLGSAITVLGKAEVTIENAKITGSGYNRSALFIGDESVVRVNNSEIEVRNGVLNEDITNFGIRDANMFLGPWLMGMTGRVRATNVMSRGTVYYNNSHIKAQYWGCLSTDGSKKIRLYATDCLIETVESGYGAYSIGDCHDYFSGCTFNVVDYGLIICDFADGTFTDGCVVNSKKVGVMMHDGSGGSVLTIDKGTVFNTRSAVIQVKGRRGADIIVDDAELNSQNEVILQTMPNDDPNMSAWDYAGGVQTYSRDVNATFSNMELNGDIINGFTASGAVNVSFRNATIRGAVTTAETKNPLGPKGEEITMQTPELFTLIGEVDNVYRPMPDDPHGITASLDADSRWIVLETSYLTGLTVEKGASITAPEGRKVTLTVDGVEKKIKPGTYTGRIVLAVSK